MTLNKRIVKVFKEHRASYIGMMILIVISASVFLGFKTSATSIIRNVDDNRREQNLEDADFKTLVPLEEADIQRYEDDFNLDLQQNQFIEIKNGYNEAVLRIIPEAETLNLPRLYDGKYLSEKNDILVDRYFFKKQNLSFGDKITLFGQEYTVRGTFTTPDTLSLTRLDTDFMADGSKYGLVLISKDTFKTLPQEELQWNYSVKFTEDNAAGFRTELAKTSYVKEWVPKDTNKKITSFDGESHAIALMSYIAPFFILTISTIILSVVLSRMLKKEYMIIGTLTAMGYKNREIYAHYLRLPIIITLFSAVVGIGIGFFLIEPFSAISTIEYNVPRPQYYIHYRDIAFILLAPLLLNMAATVLSVRRALHINIVSLLKSGKAKEKRGLLTRLIPHKKLSFKLRFKLKEIASNLPRSFLMLIGIVAASLFMLTGFLFYSSIDFLYESNLNNAFGYEYQYVYSLPQTENKTGGEPYMMGSFYYRQDGKDINFILNGIPDDARFIRPKDDAGKMIDAEKTVITKSVAKRLGWEKGDTITIVSNATLKESTITIDEICDIRYTEYVYVPLKKLNDMLGLDENTHIGVYSEKELDIDPNILSDVLTREDCQAGLETSITSFRSFLYILGAVAAVISLIVVYIVTIMLIEENRKNISLLKVMGYQNKAISGLLLNSTSFLVWLGFAVAIPVTLAIIRRFFDALTTNMFFDFNISLTWWHMLISLCLILAVYYFTLFLAKNKVYNVNMSDSMKARE